MCLDSIKIQKKRGKAIKLGADDAADIKGASKQYRYKARGTRSSQLVNKSISSTSHANY